VAGLFYRNPSGATFYAKDASISPPDSTYVLQSGSDGSDDRAFQVFMPYGSGGWPAYGSTDTIGTFDSKSGIR
jgi:hypothetical protein